MRRSAASLVIFLLIILSSHIASAEDTRLLVAGLSLDFASVEVSDEAEWWNEIERASAASSPADALPGAVRKLSRAELDVRGLGLGERPGEWGQGVRGAGAASLGLKKRAPDLAYRPEYPPHTSGAFDLELANVVKESAGTGVFWVGAGAATSFIIHEMGHEVVASFVEAEDRNISFLTTRDGTFFVGSSTVGTIEQRSMLPYNMGGEFAADMTFEYALSSYRKRPSTYNRSLLLFSATDLLRYSVYAFYMSEDHPHYDPVALRDRSGLSEEAIVGVAAAKTLLNAYRVYSGDDTVIPYFTVTREAALLNLRMNF